MLSKSKDRSKDSHLRLDPWTIYQRALGIRGLSREAFEALQREHFTYWYMPERKKTTG